MLFYEELKKALTPLRATLHRLHFHARERENGMKMEQARQIRHSSIAML